MTENKNNMFSNSHKSIFLIIKIITAKYSVGQLTKILLFFIIITGLFNSCNSRREEVPVIPPVTSPLSRDYIGFGVITASFTHITAEPSQDSVSLGYLRRGSLIRIIKRQTIRTQEGFVTWVLTDGTTRDESVTPGWLKEEVMDIYDNESQARTASEQILK